MRIALLTDPRYEQPTEVSEYVGNILEEDRLVSAALDARGVQTERVAWSREDVDWQGFDAAVFRTTWDYFDRLPDFVAWLGAVESRVRLINPPAMVRWNLDKSYLLDLSARGIPVVPTHLEPRGGDPDLDGILSARGWTEAVMKPAVSGAARHTYRVRPGIPNPWTALVAEEAMLVQPFLSDVMQNGEITLMVFDGQYSHAVLKRALPGDFRVQDDHGGTVHPFDPNAATVLLAEAAIAACDPMPAYGRVDLVRDDAGQLVVMELELIEPELWFRFCPPAATRFADALVGRL